MDWYNNLFPSSCGIYRVRYGVTNSQTQLGNWATATYCMLATWAGLSWDCWCVLSRPTCALWWPGFQGLHWWMWWWAWGLNINWAMRWSSSSLENPGSVTYLWPLGSSRAGRERKPQRLSASMFSPCITFPGVFLTKASYMVKLRFKGYSMDSIFCWEEWHSHVAKGHPCLWLQEKSVGSGEMKEEV